MTNEKYFGNAPAKSRIVGLSIGLTMLAGCSTAVMPTPTSPSGEVNQLALIDLAARTIGVSEQDVKITNVKVGKNFSIFPPPDVYTWGVETSKGTYECKTANGYSMDGGFASPGGCTRTG